MVEVTVLGIMGSPRREGNSRILLDSFLEGVHSQDGKTRVVFLQDLDYAACRACGACEKTGMCVIKDDMLRVYQEVEEAHGIVVASPVHFGSIGSKSKMAIDRFQCFWSAKYLLGKPRIASKQGKQGFFLCVGGMKPARYCENALEIVKVFFTITNINLTGHLFFREVDAAGAIRNHPTALKDAFDAGCEFVKQVKSASAG